MAEYAVHVEFQVKEAVHDLGLIEKQHLPFVLAKTLTETARGAALAVQMQTRRQFKLHGNFIPRGVRFKPAQKSDLVRFGFIESDVHTAPIISGFMPLHERGGTKLPHPGGGSGDRGKALALPGEDLKRRSYKTKSGRVRTRWKPGRLLQKYNQGGRWGPGKVVARSGRGGRKGAFIAEAKGGTGLIVRRRGRGRYPLERLYVFTPRAEIKARWRFEPTVRRYAVFAFPRKFDRNMKAAIA